MSTTAAPALPKLPANPLGSSPDLPENPLGSSPTPPLRIGRHGPLARRGKPPVPGHGIGQQSAQKQKPVVVQVKQPTPATTYVQRVGNELQGKGEAKRKAGKPLSVAAREAAQVLDDAGIRRKPAPEPEDAGEGLSPEVRAKRAEQYKGIDATMASLREPPQEGAQP